ncbi:uncharacterized protein LOC141617155 [Silene latifolia]|uniref:uncharacterized protein LOC141617155 n=1 Tax=Silene latifolia TaxID=37657 RepID=UPI003D7842EF
MDKEHFKDVLRDYCVQEVFYLVVKSEWNRYTTICATAECGWRIHASILPDGNTWAIKSINSPDHGCVGVLANNPMANCVWMAKKMIEDIRANSIISANSIQDLLMERYGLKMATSSVYKMKDIALRELMEDMMSLINYFVNTFMGLIRGCRSLIGVDGAHLKGNHGGVLLSAVALDGNNEMFPVAIGVVEAENKESWSKFFMFLKQCVSGSGGINWTIISDRQKGVDPALKMVWPDAYRRFCARHLCKNFKQEYLRILMHKLFWMVVDATSEYTFKKALEKVVQHGGNGCARWFLDLGDKEQCIKHKFNPDLACEDNTSNFVESFNSTLGVHRTNPVLSLLEGVRRMTMVKNASRKAVAQLWQDEGVCPNILQRLKELQKDSRLCMVNTRGLPSKRTRGNVQLETGQSSREPVVPPVEAHPSGIGTHLAQPVWWRGPGVDTGVFHSYGVDPSYWRPPEETGFGCLAGPWEANYDIQLGEDSSAAAAGFSSVSSSGAGTSGAGGNDDMEEGPRY